MTAQTAVSMGSPAAGLTRVTRRSAWDVTRSRGMGERTIGVTAASAAGPLTRTTPIALSQGAVARATIVSAPLPGLRASGVLNLSSLAGLRSAGCRPIHQPLLQNLEHVRHGPVEHETGRQVEEHEGE